jgi:hypothetical protein
MGMFSLAAMAQTLTQSTRARNSPGMMPARKRSPMETPATTP